MWWTVVHARWSAEGAWLRGMNSGAGLPRERMTAREMKDRDMGPVHRVWYKKDPRNKGVH